MVYNELQVWQVNEVLTMSKMIASIRSAQHCLDLLVRCIVQSMCWTSAIYCRVDTSDSLHQALVADDPIKCVHYISVVCTWIRNKNLHACLNSNTVNRAYIII